MFFHFVAGRCSAVHLTPELPLILLHKDDAVVALVGFLRIDQTLSLLFLLIALYLPLLFVLLEGCLGRV
jgi:hypothetical protein